MSAYLLGPAHALASAATKYVELPVRGGRLGFQLGWRDATSNVTASIEYTNHDTTVAPVDEAGSAWEWIPSGITVLSPSASSAGTSGVAATGVIYRRARLKLVASANSVLDVIDWTE